MSVVHTPGHEGCPFLRLEMTEKYAVGVVERRALTILGFLTADEPRPTRAFRLAEKVATELRALGNQRLIEAWGLMADGLEGVDQPFRLALVRGLLSDLAPEAAAACEAWHRDRAPISTFDEEWWRRWEAAWTAWKERHTATYGHLFSREEPAPKKAIEPARRSAPDSNDPAAEVRRIVAEEWSDEEG